MKRLIRAFSFRGRSNRLGFWRTTLSLILLSAMVEGLAVAGTLVSPVLGAVAAVLFAPLLIANVAVGVRRLHDRGKSAWWLLPFAVAPFALTAIAKIITVGADETHMAQVFGALGLLLAAFVFSIWGWIEIGFLRGKPGANRYGAPV